MKITEKENCWIGEAEDGMALCQKDETGPTEITMITAPSSVPHDAWKDCEYGHSTDDDEATEADKDAALSALGVDMTEG